MIIQINKSLCPAAGAAQPCSSVTVHYTETFWEGKEKSTWRRSKLLKPKWLLIFRIIILTWMSEDREIYKLMPPCCFSLNKHRLFYSNLFCLKRKWNWITASNLPPVHTPHQNQSEIHKNERKQINTGPCVHIMVTVSFDTIGDKDKLNLLRMISTSNMNLFCVSCVHPNKKHWPIVFAKLKTCNNSFCGHLGAMETNIGGHWQIITL